MSATYGYGNPNPTYPPPPETSAYPPRPTYPTYPPAPVNPAYPPPPNVPAYQPPPVSQPVTASTSSLTVVNTAPTPVTHMTGVSPKPRTYLGLNVITLLFFCFVFGLIGLMYSLKVDSEWKRGNHQGAYDAARMARNWGVAGIVTGVVVTIILFILVVVVIPVIIVAVAVGDAVNDVE